VVSGRWSQDGELSVMADLRQRVEQELLGNILPFWIKHAVDEEHGGFYGAC